MSATEKVTIHLDKERTVLLTLGAMKKFKEKTGKSILDEKTMRNLDEEALSYLCWACLVHEDKDLTIEQIDDMIHLGNIHEIVGALQKAKENATPKETGKSEKK